MENVPNHSEEFLIEQFKQLHEEIRALNRFAWQVPLGVLGAVGLSLSGLYALAKSLPFTNLVVSTGLIILGIITLGFVFLLGRFHIRRDFRKKEARKIQDWYQQSKKEVPFVETLPSSCEITKSANNHKKTEKNSINRVLGRWETTPIGITLLLFVALLLIVAGLVIAFCSCIN